MVILRGTLLFELSVTFMVVFLTPAVLTFILPTSTAKSSLLAIGIMLLLFLTFMVFGCRNVPINQMLFCIGYGFMSFFGIPYVVVVMFGSGFGCLVRSIFRS